MTHSLRRFVSFGVGRHMWRRAGWSVVRIWLGSSGVSRRWYHVLVHCLPRLLEAL